MTAEPSVDRKKYLRLEKGIPRVIEPLGQQVINKMVCALRLPALRPSARGRS
jgi:hypothetical protein